MDKYRTSIKKEFGTEPEFTKWLAKHPEATQKLLEITGLAIAGDYKVQAEDFTAEGKRIDFTINDDDKTQAVVESQDATGWLDQNHLYKTLGYMYDKKCPTGIILTEDISEELKGHVEDINENFEGKDIWIILNRLYKIDGQVEIDFIPVIRPYEMKPGRRILNSSNDFDYSENKALVEKIMQNHGDFFNYQSHQNGVTRTGTNWFVNKKFDQPGTWISLDCRKGDKPSKFHVGIYSKNGRYKSGWNEDSKNEFIRISKEFGCEPMLSNESKAYVNINDTEKAVEFSRAIYKSIENGKIKFDW
jgi:hypothetical protein